MFSHCQGAQPHRINEPVSREQRQLVSKMFNVFVQLKNIKQVPDTVAKGKAIKSPRTKQSGCVTICVHATCLDDSVLIFICFYLLCFKK